MPSDHAELQRHMPSADSNSQQHMPSDNSQLQRQMPPDHSRFPRRPELLAPAGSMDALRAAVNAGADAVYLGYGAFHARARARGFTEDEFLSAVPFCHSYGVRVYLTLNTLVSDRELAPALEQTETACRAGVDAVLVQDLGLLRVLRAALPDLPLHASTQMSIFTPGGVRLMYENGCTRIVTARECSREDLAGLVSAGKAEIETFVHGALCVCCSGQCTMSAVIGRRSGNRGRCAQPCRMAYMSNGKPVYALSLKDLNMSTHIPELMQSGIACLKIEGRLRRPEYVSAVVSVYARLLRENRTPAPQERQILNHAFSRDTTDAYWTGKPGPHMFTARPTDTDIRTASDAKRMTANTNWTASDAKQTVSNINMFHVKHQSISTAPRRECDPPVLPHMDCSHKNPRFTVTVTNAAQLSGIVPELRPARIGIPLEILDTMPQLPQWPEKISPKVQQPESVSVQFPEKISPEIQHPESVPAQSPEKTVPAWYAVAPRVWRERDESQILRSLERAWKLGVRGVLAGNLGHIALIRENGLSDAFRIAGDFGLNVFNSQTLAFLRELGLSGACVSFELRMAQIRDLKKILPAEAVVYGRLPLMITENRPNISGGVLRDRTGAAFPMLAAYGGRTELQNSVPLWLADRDNWRKAGLAYARLRFTTETPEECTRICRAYLARETAPGTFTRGLYERGVE